MDQSRTTRSAPKRAHRQNTVTEYCALTTTNRVSGSPPPGTTRITPGSLPWPPSAIPRSPSCYCVGRDDRDERQNAAPARALASLTRAPWDRLATTPRSGHAAFRPRPVPATPPTRGSRTVRAIAATPADWAERRATVGARSGRPNGLSKPADNLRRGRQSMVSTAAPSLCT